jgi:hypothetical protein
MNYFGLSLSLCVRDIALGAVRIEDVVMIQTQCKCETQDDWLDVFAQYGNSYWTEHPQACQMIAARLLAEGKLLPKRTDMSDRANGYCNLEHGRWMMTFRMPNTDTWRDRMQSTLDLITVNTTEDVSEAESLS